VKLGLDSYSYHYAAGLWEYLPRENAPMSALHFLRKAAELGLEGVHLCDPRHLESLEYGYITGLREQAEALGLYLELGTDSTNPDHLQNLVRAAHVLGSPLVRTSLGKPRPRGTQAMRELLAATAADIAQVLPVCERYGIHLLIENHRELTARDLVQLLEMVGTPWVGVCFDTADPLALLEDPQEAAETLGQAIKSVHLKDYQVAATSEGFALVGCALGEGVVDLAAILGLVSSRLPDAHVNIETAASRKLVPALDDDYLQHMPGASARDLGRALRVARDRGLGRMPQLPVERAASEQEILAEEDDLVLRSVRWAQQALGRPQVEAADSSD
jgi:sugar phosphate isomerase/epimerase